MADVDIRVLSADDADSLGFAKISEFERTTTVNVTDYILVSGNRFAENGEQWELEQQTRRIQISDIFAHYDGSQDDSINTRMQWFIPVVRDGIIHWEFHNVTDVGEIENDSNARNPIRPIDVASLIGDATYLKSGLLNPEDKMKLDNNLIPATDSNDGLMSKEDKSKLDGIEMGANNYVLPTASTSSLGGVKVDGTSITISPNGVIKANAGIPESKQYVLPAANWSSSTLTLKLNATIDTTKRNTIDVDPSSMDVWINNRIYAISEASDGITFRCSVIPSSDVVIYVVTTSINYITE